MKQQLSLLAGMVAALALPLAAYACGDKLTMMGGGVSFDTLNPGVNAAKIVIFLDPDSSLYPSRASLQKKLVRAGHKVSLADSTDGLQVMLRGGGFDVLLTGLTDEQTAAPVATGARIPVLLSVIYKPTPASVAGTSVAATCTARIDGTAGTQLLDVIDNVVESRGKNLAADCTPAGNPKSI